MRILSHDLRDYSPPADITRTLKGIMHKFKDTYPDVRSNVRTLITRLPTKSDFLHARQQAGDYTDAFSHFIKHTAKWLIAGGVGYALYTSCRYCKKERPVEKVSLSIQESPIQSALIAVGIGLVIGRLF